MNAMESQIAQILDEIEEYRAANKALQDEIIIAKNIERQLHQEAEYISKETSLDPIKFLSTPIKFIEAARYLDMNNLAWIYSQLGFMIHGTVPPQNVAPQFQPPPMYPPPPYYGYPMMSMYGKKNYQGDSED